MKKKLLIYTALFFFTLSAFAQTAINQDGSAPASNTMLDVKHNSTATNFWAIAGTISTTTPGGFSAGVRGINLGTGGLGIGVYGSQAGSGWGVYGTALSGIGVHGNSTNGFGMYGLSTNGTGVYGNSTNGISGMFEITNTASTSDVLGINQGGLGRGVYSVINNNLNTLAALRGETNGTGYGIYGLNTGTGNAGYFQINNAASTGSVMNVTTNGIGEGMTLNMTNSGSGGKGIHVENVGVGTGVYSNAAGGSGVWGITASISQAGILGDNTFGEAVVGRNRGGNGVGAVVGRNDSSGYGVRGFNTHDGIGVLGQAGISGGTGVGGRFENVNAANGNDALQAVTNGTGWAANFINTNFSSASRGVRISTTAGQGGNALTIANGTLALSYQHPYASNSIVDDATLVVTTTGNVTIPTGPPLVDGATIWVVNNSGGVITVTNTTVGTFNINAGYAKQFLFVSTVSGANWIPVGQ